MVAIPKPVREISEDRLEFAQQLPCLVSEYAAAEAATEHIPHCQWVHLSGPEKRCEAHHVRKGAHSGIGTKPTDFRTVPLCQTSHDEYHQIGHDTFCKKYGLDLEAHLERINREYARTQKPRSKHELREKSAVIVVKRLKAWAVVNELGNIQDLHFSKANAKASPREHVVRVEIRGVR